MTEARTTKLEALRLLDEQRRRILAAAESDSLPPRPVLVRIAELEGAIVATEAVLDGRTDIQRGDHAASLTG